MSTPLPTHEIVAVFPAEIKAGVVCLPVRMHGERQALVATKAAAAGIVAALVEAGIPAPGVKPEPVAEIPRARYRSGLSAPEFWKRIYDLYDRWLKDGTTPMREIARESGVPLGSLYDCFRKIREGNAPYAPLPKRAPLLKPNRRIL